jgi:hypothetical protein
VSDERYVKVSRKQRDEFDSLPDFDDCNLYALIPLAEVISAFDRAEGQRASSRSAGARRTNRPFSGTVASSAPVTSSIGTSA